MYVISDNYGSSEAAGPPPTQASARAALQDIAELAGYVLDNTLPMEDLKKCGGVRESFEKTPE